jgi:hypothetical protein
MGSSSPSRPLVFDEVRLCWVKATPEEQVRQRWLKWMIHGLQYPKELLVVEKELKELPHLFGRNVPERRLDILCYGKGIHPSFPLYPLVTIECKDERLTDEAIDQVIGYNHYVKAYFVAVVNFDEVRLGFFNKNEKEYQFYSVLPSFKELAQWVKP